MGVKYPIGYKLKTIGLFCFYGFFFGGDGMNVKDLIGNKVKDLHGVSLVDNCQHLIIKQHEDIDQKIKIVYSIFTMNQKFSVSCSYC